MKCIHVMAKLNFHQPLLQSAVSHADSEIIWFYYADLEETFVIVNIENSYAASYFPWNDAYYSGFFLNTVTCNQFNAS